MNRITLALVGCLGLAACQGQTADQQAASAAVASNLMTCSVAIAAAVTSAPPGTSDTQKGITAATVAASTPACQALPANTVTILTQPGPVPAAALPGASPAVVKP